MSADKKRKRDKSDTDTHKRQKKTVSLEKDTLSISVLPLNNNEQAPILAVPSGVAVPHLALQAYAKRSDAPIAEQEVMLHSSEHPRLDFYGEEETGVDADAHTKHYVGVYDPKSGELKLVKARRVKLRSTLRPSQEEIDEVKNKQYQTMATLRSELGMEFGTKQAKKIIQSMAENAVITAGSPGRQSAASKALLKSIGDNVAALPTMEELAEAAELSKPKPRANLLAQVPQDVYPIDKLIHESIMQDISVQDWLEAIAQKEPVNTTSQYVSRRLGSVAGNKDMVKLRVLKYMLMVIDFFQKCKKIRDGMKPPPQTFFKNSKHGSHLLDGIKKRFAPNGEMAKFDVDNLITHTLAMSLFVDNYITSPEDLRADFRLETRSAESYYKELGCRIKPPSPSEKVSLGLSGAENKSLKIARLEIPLEFPQVGKGAKKKGRY